MSLILLAYTIQNCNSFVIFIVVVVIIVIIIIIIIIIIFSLLLILFQFLILIHITWLSSLTLDLPSSIGNTLLPLKMK